MSQLLNKAKNYVSDKLANMKKPEAAITDVDIGSVSRNGIRYDAKVSVSNPYGTSIPICQISYVLKSAGSGSVIASGTMPDPGSLKGNESTMLDVAMLVPHNVVITLAKDIGSDWDIDYELELKLTVDLPLFGDITIPLCQKGEVKLPTFKDYF